MKASQNIGEVIIEVQSTIGGKYAKEHYAKKQYLKFRYQDAIPKAAKLTGT